MKILPCASLIKIWSSVRNSNKHCHSPLGSSGQRGVYLQKNENCFFRIILKINQHPTRYIFFISKTHTERKTQHTMSPLHPVGGPLSRRIAGAPPPSGASETAAAVARVSGEIEFGFIQLWVCDIYIHKHIYIIPNYEYCQIIMGQTSVPKSRSKLMASRHFM